MLAKNGLVYKAPEEAIPACVRQILDMDQEALAALQGEGDYVLPEDFFSAPNHHMARLVRDMFADENVAATMAVRAEGLGVRVQLLCNSLYTGKAPASSESGRGTLQVSAWLASCTCWPRDPLLVKCSVIEQIMVVLQRLAFDSQAGYVFASAISPAPPCSMPDDPDCRQ